MIEALLEVRFISLSDRPQILILFNVIPKNEITLKTTPKLNILTILRWTIFEKNFLFGFYLNPSMDTNSYLIC